MATARKPDFSLWVEVDSALKTSVADWEPGEETLDELVELRDCFELMERVWPSSVSAAADIEAGLWLGPYQLVRQIGRGGMGTVWEAEQHTPIQRRLAIKILTARPGINSLDVRFDAERDVLSRMDHPNITRILDAGTTPDGLAYFAMDLVEGTDIFSYCRERELSLESRLRLYLQACSAVQHAHQKGIIHRDLKPSNVLVGEQDGNPVVKVIDFGLARIVDAEPQAGETTRTGAVVGSLWYMSPEQTGSDFGDVDTRTDVYLLGALLYQLLTGSPLLSHETLESSDIAKILTEIREKPPQRPSRRLQQSANSVGLPDLAECVSACRSELDWVVLRAVEKESDRRYGSVAELAADVQRFLDNEPIVSKPPSLRYTAKKYFERNRAITLAVVGTAMALVLTACVAIWGFVNVSAANKKAEQRLSQADASNAILVDIFSDLEFDSEKATTPLRIRLAERLISASKLLRADSVGDPEKVIRLQFKLAETLDGLGFAKEAHPISQLAYEGALQHDLDRETVRATARLYAETCAWTGDTTTAHELLVQIIEECSEELEPNSDETLESRLLFGRVLFMQGKRDDAIEVFKKVAAAHEEIGDDELKTLAAKYWEARCYAAQRKGELAEPILQHCLDRYRELLPKGHPRILSATVDLSWALLQMFKVERSRKLADEAYQLAKETFGDRHEVTWDAMAQVGLSAWQMGEREFAKETIATALKGMEWTRSRELPGSVMTGQMLSRMYRDSGEPELALPIMKRNLEIERGRLPADNPIIINMTQELGTVHAKLGNHARARELFEQAIKSNTGTYRGSRAMTGQILRQLGQLSFDHGEFQEAVDIWQRRLKLLTEADGPYGFDTAICYSDVAEALDADGRGSEAVSLLEKYRTDFQQAGGGDFRAEQILTAQLGVLLSHNGELERGIQLMESVVNSGVRLRRMDYLKRELHKAQQQLKP